MNLFADIRALVLSDIVAMSKASIIPYGLATNNVTVEPPRDAAHGDMSTNAAMVLAKPTGMKPREIAEALAERLLKDPRIISAEVAGPGFLNLRLSPVVWQGLIAAILGAGTAFGRSNVGQGIKVNIEFVSANPTGPLHVGHTRGAVFGDALASLLDFAGYVVTREYYINDGGAQVDVLARSVYLRYLEAHGQHVAFPDGTYPGNYLIDVGEALKAKVGKLYVGKGEDVWLNDIRSFATDAMMKLIKTDLAALGVKMDKFFSEKSLYNTGLIEAALENLRGRGLIYEGVLEPPKGKKPDDWEPRKQTLFRSIEHGDDVDRPVMKSDGSWTYFAPDIAYHYDKVQRGYDLLIDIFGADHGGYVKRMKAAVSALSGGKVPLEIKLTQLVKLFKNGEPFKMSKRSGTFVTLRDVVDHVGSGVTRFHMLTRKNDAQLDFDFDKVLEQSRENPVFYVQYALARVSSVIDKATEAGVLVDNKTLSESNLSLLINEEELALAVKLAEWPRLVETAARANEPHRVAFYLYDLAGTFHSLWNKGNELPELRFLQDDLVTSQAKIALARACAVVITAGLGILGVEAVKELR